MITTGLLSCTEYVNMALLRSIHALENESELAINVAVGEQGGWLDGVVRLVLWFFVLCFRSSLLLFWFWPTRSFGQLSTNSHSHTTIQQLGGSAAPPQAPNLDRYVVVHVVTTCDEHGVCVTKDSAEVNQFRQFLLSINSLSINLPADPMLAIIRVCIHESARQSGRSL